MLCSRVTLHVSNSSCAAGQGTIRDHAVAQAEVATGSADAGTGDAAALVRDVYERIWTRGDVRAIEHLVALRYTIHSDPGDPWAGRTLDRKAYEERMRYSRDAFPGSRVHR